MLENQTEVLTFLSKKTILIRKEVKTMKLSIYKSYDDLPLFLNARTVANVLGVSISSAYELMHEPDFPTLKVGSRLAVPRDAFRQWAERKAGGAK